MYIIRVPSPVIMKHICHVIHVMLKHEQSRGKWKHSPFILHLIIKMNARTASNLVLPLFALPVIIRVAGHSFAFALRYGHKSASAHRSYFKVWAHIKVHLFITFSLILDVISVSSCFICQLLICQ